MSKDLDRRVDCANCDWTGTEGETITLTGAAERVAPGEIMPAGECPDCGAVAHLVNPIGYGAIPYTPADDEGPAGIVSDALAMLDCIARVECFDGATGGYFVLRDGREFRFTVDEAAGEGICTACGRDSLDCSRDPCAAVIEDRGEDAETCKHCGEERGLPHTGSLWTCGACNGLNETADASQSGRAG